jgi:hypothetical protein
VSLHPHQHRALVAAVGAFPDAAAAFATLSAGDGLKGLGRTRFLTAAELAAIPEKRRPAGVVLVTDEERAAFPTGLPGFPNKLRREWFDAAWTEARG